MNDPSSWKEAGISPDAASKLSLFVDLILEWNARINLTGLRTRTEIEERLIGESVAALRALPVSGKTVLDFGSGAGIPGLVWAACDDSARITSLEIRQKKVAFQKEVLRTAGIDAEVVQGHFPEAVTGRQFDVIVTRAIRFSPSLWTAAEALLAPGGCLVRFGTPRQEEPGWSVLPISPGTTLLIRKP